MADPAGDESASEHRTYAAGPRHSQPSQSASDSAKRRARKMPTPKEWAAEQVKHAPTRSAAWVRSVEAIYGLDIRDK